MMILFLNLTSVVGAESSGGPRAAGMSLPYVGLGRSSNARRADSPHPYRLLEAVPKAFDFIEYSAPLVVTEARAEATFFAQMVAERSTLGTCCRTNW